MAFKKTGSFGIAASKRLNSLHDWPASIAGSGGQQDHAVRTASRPSTPGEVVAQVPDPDRWIFVHTTIMASVDLEDGSEFLIREASEKWVNDNGDAWERGQLLKDFGTFRNAAVYVEHNQHPEHAKGKVFDVVARDMGDTVLIDVLFGVDKRHDNLVNNITAGILNAVSMGCSTAFTKCSACGNKAHTENDYCEHVKSQKRQSVQAHGRLRKVAELCYDNNFFDCSIVASPAFTGAVFRRLVAGDSVLRRVFANILCSKIEEDPEELAGHIRKAASLSERADAVAAAPAKVGAGTAVFSTRRGPGSVESVGEKLASVRWEDGTLEPVAIGSIESPGDDRVLACTRLPRQRLAAKPEVPDTDRVGYHPITNTDTRKREYQIDDRDFSPIPQTNNVGRTHSIDAHNAANPTTKLEGTEEDFDGVTIRCAALFRHHRCPTCKSAGLEFERRAASMAAGNASDTVLCQDCGAVDMTDAYRGREAKALVDGSPELLLAIRTAASLESPDARAAFLNATARSKSAGASARHVERRLLQVMADAKCGVGKADAVPNRAPDTGALEKLASEHGAVTTSDVVRECGAGEASDLAAVRLARRGVDVLPASLPVAELRSLEERLAARLGGRWSKVRAAAIGGDAIEHPIARDRVFLAWEGAMDDPLDADEAPPIYCEVCLGDLDAGVCRQCGRDASGDCHECGDEDVPLFEGRCAPCFHADVDARAADAAEWGADERLVAQTDPALLTARRASFEKWPRLLDGLDVPDATDERRAAAAELARLVDSRRVNVRIEASRKVSRILQAHPEFTVSQAKAVLWQDLCEFMPAHEAGHVVSKVIDVKTNDQFGLGRNWPLGDARKPVEEPGTTRTMRAASARGER
jgi:hypothetical protein